MGHVARGAADVDGSELRRLRGRLGLSVDQFAAELDVPAEMLRRWEAAEARIPRQRLKQIPAQVARLERERQRVWSPRTRGPRRKGASRLVLLVPVLLLAASVIGYLPASEAWLVVLFPLSFLAAGVLGVNVLRGLPWLRSAGALGRWMANGSAASAAIVGFLGTFLVSGYSTAITEAEPLSFTATVLTGMVMGVLYATFCSLAEMFGGSR